MNYFRERVLKTNIVWIGAGVLVAFLLCVPYLILGENAVVSYHDQLDGELITYLLNAKYLFSGVENYPEIMGGIDVKGMVSPAPLYVLFFKVFPPFFAFMCGMVLNKIIQFLFMFLLLEKLTRRKMLSFLTAVWFACLPFYTVYGLCIPGQPMLVYALLQLWKGPAWRDADKIGKESPLKNGTNRTGYLGAIALIVFYGFSSSLALCGFAVLAVLTGWLLWGLLRKKKEQVSRLLLGWIALFASYVLCNLSLLGQLFSLSQSEFVSHKKEMRISAIPFWECFWKILLHGEDYCNAYSEVALGFGGIVALIGMGLFLRKGSSRKSETTNEEEAFQKMKDKWKGVLALLCGLLAIAIWRAFYQSPAIVAIRNQSVGVLHDFNFGRFTWLMPTLWCLCFALASDAVLSMAEGVKKHKKFIRACCCAGILAAVAFPCLLAIYQGDLKPNLVKLLRRGDYYMMTWKQFYAEDLFAEADKLIGRPKEEYRVVSLGIYPAAATYNGFYCLDAYSNNYDINYKHEFRRIIAPQLAKNEYLRTWFDEWGNRCYMLTAQFGNYFTFEKKWGTYTDDYEFDLDALKEMGGEYIISAVYLNHWEEGRLKLLNEEPIQTEDSWYRLWVYEVK